MQIVITAAVITLLTVALAIFSYLHRLYQENPHGAPRRVREHLEDFHLNVAPRLRLERRRAANSFSLLAQITLVLAALAIGYASESFAHDPARAVFETAFFVVLEILLVYQFVPNVLLIHSSGNWLGSLATLLRGLAYTVLPMLLVYEFLNSLLRLTEDEEEPGAEEPSHAIEDLVEEAQERGLVEKEDVPLIASVILFADKTAREVMTPRPDITGIKATASVAELRKLVREKRFSRVPVLGDNLDDAKGVVFVRDILEVPDAEAADRKVGELMRPAMFVPETKFVVDLVREMQRERQEMAVVVDEYGGVAGLITLEDLAEEIIGEISDADQVRRAEVVKEGEDTFLVRGGIELERLRGVLEIPLDSRETNTLAGLVHTWFGRVPKPGESLERDGLHVEVLEATPRRVVRLRLVRKAAPTPVRAARKPRRRKQQPAQ